MLKVVLLFIEFIASPNSFLSPSSSVKLERQYLLILVYKGFKTLFIHIYTACKGTHMERHLRNARLAVL